MLTISSDLQRQTYFPHIFTAVISLLLAVDDLYPAVYHEAQSQVISVHWSVR